MSSTTELSRTRSIRRPTINNNESAQIKSAHGRKESRNVSPSRLPMRPPPTTTTTTSRTRAPTGLTSRQVSGGPSSKTSSRPVGSTNGASAAAKPLGRAQSIRQPPSATTTTTSTTTKGRSATTVARPRSSGGVASTTAPKDRYAGHARAKSTVTTLTAATTLRPLTHTPSRSNPSPAPSTASSTSTATQTTSVTSTRAKTRSQTQHTRMSSQSQLQPQSHAPSALAARRPAFNTNQQHYSPAKTLAPKPLTSTFLAPPSPSKQPVNVAITAETSRLQTELLQLSLLHREAHGVSASWHASARSKLGARFSEVAAADRALQAVEREGAEARGLRDLIRWGNAGPEDQNGGTGRDRRSLDRERLPLDEKIQLLDQVLNGVWALDEPGGRYQRTVSAFEDWALRVAEIRAAQQGGDIDGLLARGGGFEIGGDGEGEELGIFVSELDADAWKRDHAGLVRILEGWQRTLAQLGQPETDKPESHGKGTGDKKGGASKSLSGLARTLRGCRSLVRDMLAELRAMEQIEQDALAAEEDWMEQMEARLRAEEEEGDGSRRRKTEDVPPWKSLIL